MCGLIQPRGHVQFIGVEDFASADGIESLSQRVRDRKDEECIEYRYLGIVDPRKGNLQTPENTATHPLV